jgi:TetR/AcrR family transcriptional regulator, transcriptional repressor for nem operon
LQNEIKKATNDLLISKGYAGLRYADIAEQLHVTRANIHYHFGNKQALCEIVIIEEIDRGIEIYRDILLRNNASIRDKITAISKLNKDRYLAYNPTGKTNFPWALIPRMRFERDLLTPKCNSAISLFRIKLEEHLGVALRIAIEKGELEHTTPIRDFSLLFVAIVNGSDATTRDTRSFKRVEELFDIYVNILEDAHGVATLTSSESS